MVWYERAMWLDPGLGDPWYYIGWICDRQQKWLQALNAHERAIASGRFRQVGHSNPYYRAGSIYQQRLKPYQSEKAQAAYEAAWQ